jgi:hypothetical protein
VLSVGGELSASALFLDTYTAAYAKGGIRALIYASTRYWEQLQPDIANEREGEDGRFFPPALLDRYGDLDFERAIAAARAGEPLFLPGVEVSFPTRLQPRPT